MEELILLRDEVQFLRWLHGRGGVGAVGQFSGDSVRSDFLDAKGLIRRSGEVAELTSLGERIAGRVTDRDFVEVVILTAFEVEALQR
ncbi:hypothetical protein [Planctomyces sp. SH-PL14]|uniref:hypothetical protein n=1 Tax=Planctomyces sp. SH-PL14 TaxID=1632864 RepID=UPI0009462213|nr:hypothetical protein [Planctomyces sp. SH-PL14]